MHILLVDDEPELLDLVSQALTDDGHLVERAKSVSAAVAAVNAQSFNVVVLDLGLPDGSGLDVCRHLRVMKMATPVLMLTALSAVAQRVESLDCGADDFLGKPFAIAELKARVRALGRRTGTPAGMYWQHGPLTIDFPRRRALVDGKELPITAREWSILEVLALAGGRVVARERLLEEVWGERSEMAAASLEVLINRIRKKLGITVIRTLRGEGYALA